MFSAVTDAPQHPLLQLSNAFCKSALSCATGAPQNHWFGPAGDPRGAGIGTPEAIKLVWSCHREIINDVGPIPEGTALTQT